MLKRLFSSSTDHPLADVKEARRVLTELATREPAIGIEEAATWLESMAADEGFKLEQRLDVALQLDEVAAAHSRRLAREYLTAPRLGRSQEMKLWQENHGFWVALIQVYELCLAAFEAKAKGADDIKPRLPLLHCRLLNAFEARLKWEQFRYGPIDGRLWQSAGRIYLSAVANKIALKGVQLYSTVVGETHVEREYLRLLVFQASAMNNLMPLEIEIAERLIAHFLPRFVFTDQVRPDNVHWVDAAKPLPPTRLAKLPEITPTLRFFNAGAALEAVAELRARVEQTGEAPADLALGGQYSVRALVGVFDHLVSNWAPKPPMRSHARHPVKSRLAVVYGLDNITTRLVGAPSGIEPESWVVDDVSVGGMGAQVQIGVRDWIRIGVLLGLQPDGGNNWLLAVVRRFTRESDRQGSVGVETLGKTPRAITADSAGLRTDVILLESAIEAGSIVRVVMPINAWEDRVAMTFAHEGRTARLQPLKLVETGPDYVIGSYTVTSLD